MDLFSDDARRNPYPAYGQLRAAQPVFHEPRSGLWMVFDYAGVHRMLTDFDSFSSRNGPDWMIFHDPPRHTKLRALISRAFTPRSIASLEPRIAAIARELLDRVVARGDCAMDLALDFAVPLPITVIAEMLGIPPDDRPRFVRWNDVLLRMSYTIGNATPDAKREAIADFMVSTAEMGEYLGILLNQRRATPQDDLLTRLVQAEVEGARLTHAEILGFFQLLLLAGSETTTNLINLAILCFIEHPDQLARVRERPAELLPSAIEEVLRYRSPLQWMYRVARRDLEMHGQVIPAGKLALAMIGSANRDPRQFPEPDRFDVTRDPNAHLAFGHGNHFCLGAPLARLEGRIALSQLLRRLDNIERANAAEPWEPREGLHVHGPARLPIRFSVRREDAAQRA
jgi:cytochrome P450